MNLPIAVTSRGEYVHARILPPAFASFKLREWDAGIRDLTSEKARLVLDFSSVESVSSSVLGFLLRVSTGLAKKGGILLLHSVQPQVRRIMQMTCLDLLIPIASDAKEADERMTIPVSIPDESASRANLALRVGEKHMIIPVDSILFLSADRGGTQIQTVQEMFQTPRSLRELSALLPAERFMRIHKSYIVNTDRVAQMEYAAGGMYRLTLRDRHHVLPVGRAFAAGLRKRLGLGEV